VVLRDYCLCHNVVDNVYSLATLSIKFCKYSSKASSGLEGMRYALGILDFHSLTCLLLSMGFGPMFGLYATKSIVCQVVD
jgi:hypothetical protein